ncbi:MAG: hypothetical protein COA79_03885 [Planctomycetota bacterium]|nr:MAG: hypothetical protein COA79_03885 [Planctomycetota bacterium]
MKTLRRKKEEGSIVYLAVMGFGVLFIFMAFMNDMVVRNKTEVEFRIKLDGEALNISEAGLFETLAQFQKNGNMTQKRNPQRDSNGDPVEVNGEAQYLNSENFVNFNFIWTCRNVAVGCPKVLEDPYHFELAYEDLFVDKSAENCEICQDAGRAQKGFYIPNSEEPKIGIVRNFDVNGQTVEYDPINGGLVTNFGDLKVRYEVWERMVEDYSKETGADSADSGRVWIARSIGIVYRVNKVGTAPKEMETLATVVQSRMYKKPAIFFLQKAALHNTNVNGFVTLNANAQVINNGDPLTVTSSFYGKQSNLGAAHQGGNIVDFMNGGDPAIDTTELTFESVFGLSQTELKEFADTYISDISDPRTYDALLNSEIKYVEGDLDFGLSNPLFGNGLLIVDGDVTLSDTGHKFDGVLWVTGDVTISAGGYIKGTLVAGTSAANKRTISLKGKNANDWFRVYYDQEAIDAINNAKFKYAMFRVPYVKKGKNSIILTQEEKDLRTELILARYPAD